MSRLNQVDENYQFHRGEWVVLPGVVIQRLRLVPSLDSTTLRWGPPLGEAQAKGHSPTNGALDQPLSSGGDQLSAQIAATTKPSAPPEATPAGVASKPSLPPADGPGGIHGPSRSFDRSIDALVRDGTIRPRELRVRGSIEVVPAVRMEACAAGALSAIECQTGVVFGGSGPADRNLNPSRSNKQPRSRGQSTNGQIPTTAVSLRRKARENTSGFASGNSNAASVERLPKDSLRRRLDAYRDAERQSIIDRENARREAEIREAALQAERERLEALKWRTYGQRKVKWDEWKLDDVGNRITRFEVIDATSEDRSRQAGSSSSDLGDSNSDPLKNTTRSNYSYGRIAVSCETLRLITTLALGEWGIWALPEKGTPEESLVVDLCSNVAIRKSQIKQDATPSGVYQELCSAKGISMKDCKNYGVRLLSDLEKYPIKGFSKF